MSLKVRVSLVFEDPSLPVRAGELDYQRRSNGPRLSSVASHGFENGSWSMQTSNLVEFKRFLHITNRNSTMQQVCSEILERYVKLYPNDADIVIEKLQDSEYCDLDPDYSAGSIFNEGDVVVAFLSEPPSPKYTEDENAVLPIHHKRKYQSEYISNDSYTSFQQKKRTKRDSIWFHTNSSFSRDASIEQVSEANITLSVLPHGLTNPTSPVLGKGPRLSPPEERGHGKRPATRRSATNGASSESSNYQKSRLNVNQSIENENYKETDGPENADEEADGTGNASSVSLPPPKAKENHLPDPHKLSPFGANVDNPNTRKTGNAKASIPLPIVESTPLSTSKSSKALNKNTLNFDSPSRSGPASQATQDKPQTPNARKGTKSSSTQDKSNVSDADKNMAAKSNEAAEKPTAKAASKKGKKQPAKEPIVLPDIPGAAEAALTPTPTKTSTQNTKPSTAAQKKALATSENDANAKKPTPTKKAAAAAAKKTAQPAPSVPEPENSAVFDAADTTVTIAVPAKLQPKPARASKKKAAEAAASKQNGEAADQDSDLVTVTSANTQPAKTTAKGKPAASKANSEVSVSDASSQEKAPAQPAKKTRKTAAQKAAESSSQAEEAVTASPSPSVAGSSKESASDKKKLAAQKKLEEKERKAAEAAAAKLRAAEEKNRKLAEEKAAKAKAAEERAKKLAEDKLKKITEEKAKAAAEKAKADEEKAKKLAEEKAAAEEKAKKLAEVKALAAKKAAEEKAKKVAEEKAAAAKKAEEQKAAAAKKAEEEKAAKAKAAEEKAKKLAEEKAAAAKKAAEQKEAKAKVLAEEKKKKEEALIAEKKKAEEKRLAAETEAKAKKAQLEANSTKNTSTSTIAASQARKPAIRTNISELTSNSNSNGGDDEDADMVDVFTPGAPFTGSVSAKTAPIKARQDSSSDSSDSSSDDSSSDDDSDNEEEPKPVQTSVNHQNNTPSSTQNKPDSAASTIKKMINLPGLSKLSSLVARGPVTVHESNATHRAALSKIRRPGGRPVATQSQNNNSDSDSSVSSSDSDDDDSDSDSDSDAETKSTKKAPNKFGKAPAPSTKKAPVSAATVTAGPLANKSNGSIAKNGKVATAGVQVPKVDSAAAKKQKAKDLEELF